MGTERQATGATIASLLFGLVAEVVGNTVRLGSAWTPAFWIILAELFGLLVWHAVRKERARKAGDPNPGTRYQDIAANDETAAQDGTLRMFEWKDQVQRAGAFQVRKAVRRLDAALAAGGSVVLRGMSGVGKTQLAAEYARRVRASGCVDVLWVDASSRENIRAACQLLDRLTTSERHWLVVLDDLRDPRDLDDLVLRRTPRGQVIVTTRRRDAVRTGKPITVKPFTPGEAVRFLTRRLPVRQAEGAAELAEALGYLPQALAEAAAFIAENLHLTCRDYRDRFDHPHYPLAQLRPDHLPDGLRDTIVNTWSEMIGEADRLAPQDLAGPVLALASLIDHRGVPEEVLTAAISARYLPAASGHAVSAESVKKTLSRLHRRNLLTYTPCDPTRAVRVHPVVARAVCEKLGRWRTELAALAAADALVRAWPSTERDRLLAERLRANVAALRRRADTYLWHPQAWEVLFRAGHSLGGCGQEKAAHEYFRELADSARDALGDRHLTTLRARACQANWSGEAGDPLSAYTTLDNLRHDMPRVSRHNRRFTLVVRRSHARWLSDAGYPRRAVELLRELRPEFVRVFGPFDKETFYTRHFLARCLADLGDVDAAAELMRAVVDDLARCPDPERSDPLSARNNLGAILVKTGDLAGAILVFNQLIGSLIDAVGPDSPKTLRTRNNLACCRIESGDPESALTDLPQLAEDCERVLGADHPLAVSVHRNLTDARARAEGRAGRLLSDRNELDSGDCE